MSVQAMAWAMDVPTELLDAAPARHVLLLLANYAGEDGRGAFPAVATLVRQSGLSQRTVQNALARLTELELIRPGNAAIAAAWIGRADRRPNVWDLALERGAPAAPRAVNGVQLTTSRGAPAAPDPSDNRKPISYTPDLDQIPLEVWERWHTFRVAKSGKGWTDDARDLSARKLRALAAEGHDPAAVVEQSIEAGWTGLFALKPNGGNHANDVNRRARDAAAGSGRSLADRVADTNRKHDERELRGDLF